MNKKKVKFYYFDVIINEGANKRNVMLRATSKLEAMQKMYNICVAKQWLSYEFTYMRRPSLSKAGEEMEEKLYENENIILKSMINSDNNNNRDSSALNNIFKNKKSIK